MTIPKIIHHVGDQQIPSPLVRACIESSRYLNANWEHRYYDPSKIDDIIKEHLSPIKNLCSSMPQTFKFLLARLLLLKLHGGVSIHIELECVRPIDELLSLIVKSQSELYISSNGPMDGEYQYKIPEYSDLVIITCSGGNVVNTILEDFISILREQELTDAEKHSMDCNAMSILTQVISRKKNQGSKISQLHWKHFSPIPKRDSVDIEALDAPNDGQRGSVHDEMYFNRVALKSKFGNDRVIYKECGKLLCSVEERVENKLQWIMRRCNKVDHIHSCAIVELVRSRASVVVLGDAIGSAVVARFFSILNTADIRPRSYVWCRERNEMWSEGFAKLCEKGFEMIDGDIFIAGQVLFVGDSNTSIGLEEIQDVFGHNIIGMVLGPEIENVDVYLSEDGLTLSFFDLSKQMTVPRIIHVINSMNSREKALFSVAANKLKCLVKYWPPDYLENRARAYGMGFTSFDLMDKEQSFELKVLWLMASEGGVIFKGSPEWCLEASRWICLNRPGFYRDGEKWVLAMPAGVGVSNGIVDDWIESAIHDNSYEFELFMENRFIDAQKRHGQYRLYLSVKI